MERYLLCRVDFIGTRLIASLDSANTDDLKAVVTQYMHENGMTFEIKSESIENGQEWIMTEDEDGWSEEWSVTSIKPSAEFIKHNI